MEYRKILLALMIAMEGTLCASAQNLQAYAIHPDSAFFCDRDGIPRPELSLIGYERRTGYSWYNNKPAQLFPLYEQWKKRHGRG